MPDHDLVAVWKEHLGQEFAARNPASLGACAVRYSFTVTDFDRPPLAGLTAHSSTPSQEPAPTYNYSPANGSQALGLQSYMRPLRAH